MNREKLLQELENEIQNKLGYYGLLLFHYETSGENVKTEIMRKEIHCVSAYHAHIVNIIKRHLDEDND